MAMALQHVHSNGYYHNDVTINNILISETEPFTEIYTDNFINIIINVDKYFAVLSDIHPLCPLALV